MIIFKEQAKFFTIIFVVLIIRVQASSNKCNQSCGSNRVPYPFGFSEECPIQLNCSSSSGQIFINQFPVLEVTEEGIKIGIEQKCDRRIESFRSLFTKSYAPKSTNAVLLYSCSANQSFCNIPGLNVQTHFEPFNCSSKSRISCFSHVTSDGLLSYDNMTRTTQCQYVLSSISMESKVNVSGTSLEVQVMELQWWVPGNCNCSRDADCVRFPGTSSGLGFRCRCRNGFDGDGYQSGVGCNRVFSTRSILNLRKKLVIGVTCGGGITISCVILLCLSLRKKLSSISSMIYCTDATRSNRNVESFLRNHGALSLKRYSFSDVNKMTNSFKHQLGQGGYGSVYKGKLRNSCLVAVKVLNISKANGEEFINEVASISRTSHVNIVNLLGFCVEGRKRIIIYEFMPNGSLDQALIAEQQLGWENSYQIALGVARGLEYLHRGCNMRIVHLDIKPHNILLDEDLCPKISDFGLAKLVYKKESAVSLAEARGTLGYIAPEVFMKHLGRVTYKSDVYSYGMMVLEMVGARNKAPEEVENSTDKYFPNWIYTQLDEASDMSETFGLMTVEEAEVVRKMTIVGLWCIQTKPSDRPSMSKVIEMLEGGIETLQIPEKPSWSPARLPALESTSLSIN